MVLCAFLSHSTFFPLLINHAIHKGFSSVCFMNLLFLLYHFFFHSLSFKFLMIFLFPWKLIIYTNIYYCFILLSFLLWINNKQWHCGSWAHLITKHHDTEDTLPVEITCIFVACATIHRWRSQPFKNKPTQTCLGWKSLSTWKPQAITTRYINSTQSPSATLPGCIQNFLPW